MFLGDDVGADVLVSVGEEFVVVVLVSVGTDLVFGSAIVYRTDW